MQVIRTSRFGLDERRLFWLAIVLFASGVLAAAAALARYAEAYEWVAHTSDVRVSIGRALSDATAHVECTRLDRDVDEFAQLTADNPQQQARVMTLRAEVAPACAGADITRLVRDLGEADATERRLLDQRREPLDRVRRWALAALFGTLLAAIALITIARAIQRRVVNRLAESEERFRQLAANATDLIRIHEPSGRALYATPSSTRLLGYTPAELCSVVPIEELGHPDDVEKMREVLVSLASPVGERTAITHRYRTKSGDYRWFETRVQPVRDAAGKLLRYYSTSRDVTDTVEIQRRLNESAVTDEMTGLYNRRGFVLVAEPALQLAVRHERGVAVLFIDLDGLKSINDRLGHEAGDRAIRELADLLRETFRSSDVLARLGGDEFVVLANELEGPQAALAAERLRSSIERRNESDQPFELAASIGIAILEPGTGERTLDDLIAEADSKMYASKKARRAHCDAT